MRNILLSFLTFIFTLGALAQNSEKLTGTVIGTETSVDYNSGSIASNTVNTRANAFDGDLGTYFASYVRSNTWVGLDLGTPHVITQVGWSPRNDSNGPKRVQLALFEGSNDPDFHDAFPLYLVPDKGTIGTISHADVNVSLGFRYVRYCGPNDVRCNVAEVEFYGYESEGDSSHFYQITNLPTISIHTASGVDPQDKETDIEGWINTIYADGTMLQQHPITTKLRGNASKDFPKKPYKFKFEDGKKHHMLKDTPEESPAKAKKWTLINNYGDKTLMRNILAFQVSRFANMKFTPYCQPVDVIMNGEYKGCYQLSDQIEVGKNRVNITEMDSTCVADTALTGGYMVEVDAYYYDEDCYFWSTKGNPVTIKYPKAEDITPEQKEYINGYFNLLESRLFSSNYTSATLGYRSMLDCKSFADHFLVGEFSGNTDTYWSTYMTKDRNIAEIEVGPVWDFDLAFENDNRTYPICNNSSYIYASSGSYAGQMRSFVNRLLSSSYMQGVIKDEWISMRRRGLNADSFCEYIDSLRWVLDKSQELNFIRWPIMNSYVHQNPVVWGSYEAEVENVKNYVRDRVTWMDKKQGYNFATDDLMEVAPLEEHSDKYYDLSGRQIRPGRSGRGIYISNGKKVFYKDF